MNGCLPQAVHDGTPRQAKGNQVPTRHQFARAEQQGLYEPRFEHDACGIGFVVDIKGRRSNQILRQALTVLTNLAHRGALGSEPNTGDGAGILIQVPDRLLRQACAQSGIVLPEPGRYGVGMLFLPPDPAQRRACEDRFAAIVAHEGQQLLGWRTVPTDNKLLGQTALAGEPVIRQVFIGCSRLLRGQLVGPDHRLQGDANPGPIGGLLPGSVRSGCGDGSSPGSLTL
jgi:glutamate synthase domain-containing protein 1